MTSMTRHHLIRRGSNGSGLLPVTTRLYPSLGAQVHARGPSTVLSLS